MGDAIEAFLRTRCHTRGKGGQRERENRARLRTGQRRGQREGCGGNRLRGWRSHGIKATRNSEVPNRRCRLPPRLGRRSGLASSGTKLRCAHPLQLRCAHPLQLRCARNSRHCSTQSASRSNAERKAQQGATRRRRSDAAMQRSTPTARLASGPAGALEPPLPCRPRPGVRAQHSPLGSRAETMDSTHFVRSPRPAVAGRAIHHLNE
jgi:hypothetical protein